MFKRSREEGVEDIESAFLVLKASYAAYQYFGGDQVFDQAKSVAVTRFKALEEQGKNLNWRDLRDILCESLSFIRDGHFGIEGRAVSCYKWHIVV